jgi:hypothetical protein
MPSPSLSPIAIETHFLPNIFSLIENNFHSHSVAFISVDRHGKDTLRIDRLVTPGPFGHPAFFAGFHSRQDGKEIRKPRFGLERFPDGSFLILSYDSDLTGKYYVFHKGSGPSLSVKVPPEMGSAAWLFDKMISEGGYLDLSPLPL